MASSIPQARNGELYLMCAGDAAAYARVQADARDDVVVDALDRRTGHGRAGQSAGQHADEHQHGGSRRSARPRRRARTRPHDAARGLRADRRRIARARHRRRRHAERASTRRTSRPRTPPKTPASRSTSAAPPASILPLATATKQQYDRMVACGPRRTRQVGHRGTHVRRPPPAATGWRSADGHRWIVAAVYRSSRPYRSRLGRARPHDLRPAAQAGLRSRRRRGPRRRARSRARRASIPYTRGIHPNMYRDRLVDDAPVRRLRQRAPDQRALPLPARAGPDGAVGRLRHADADGLRLRRAAGAAAKSASAASRSTRVRDMETLFEGIDMGAITTSMTINGPAAIALAQYIVAAENKGIPRARARRHAAGRHPQGIHRAERVDLSAAPARAASSST